MCRQLTIIKRDHEGREVTRYPGKLIEEGNGTIVVETVFPFHVANDTFTIEQGDRMIETFSEKHWYNIFQIHAGEGPHLRGWYCNIARPIECEDGLVWQDDLALDLWVTPDGRLFLLDMEEFLAIDLPEADRDAALAGLSALEKRIRERQAPFDLIG